MNFFESLCFSPNFLNTVLLFKFNVLQFKLDIICFEIDYKIILSLVRNKQDIKQSLIQDYTKYY